MKILFALPGLHRVQRGAEIAFISIAEQLVKLGEEVTLAGSGPPMASSAYDYIQIPAADRTRFEGLPGLPFLRNETHWEDASFAWSLFRNVDVSSYGLTVACSFPFTHFALRAGKEGGNPPHVFVTQNGDWPAFSNKSEYRLFDCDGLVCINPAYLDRNRERYRSALIPNGVDLNRFGPGSGNRKTFGLPTGVPLALMVSAMIESKKVHEAVEAVAGLAGVHLAVAGDGPERGRIHALADRLMPGRFHQLGVEPVDMPLLYRSADCFVHLSRDESFGNVYVEAMACGTPTIVCDVPHTRWVLGDTARFTPVGDLAALGQAIREAVQTTASSKQKAAQAERAKQFSWDKIAVQYQQFFYSLMDRTEGSEGQPCPSAQGV